MLALYRKYRPKNLSEVVGQDQVTKPLESALKSNKINHSYLFTGPRGCGKTSVARILAHEVNGLPYELEDNYLDIIEIDAASNTGVDNIRDLREKAVIAPSNAKYKVYIIDEVHMLSKPAFNALLKTLEEPPSQVIFILATTDIEKVPITITSRSQVFTFRLAPPEVMLPHLKTICKKEKINISENALKLICEKGGGSFRDSLSLLDQISSLSNDDTEITETEVANTLGLPMESKITALLDTYETGDFKNTSEKLKSLLLEGLKAESIATACLTRIIANPKPGLLPLLGELPKVSAPYPEAKLLLAFLTNQSINNNYPKQPVKEPTIEIAPKEAPKNIQEAPRPEEPKQPKEAPKKEYPSKEKAVLTPALKSMLAKCKIIETENSIEIFPSKPIVKTILERKGNADLLRQHYGKTFTIHSPEDTPNSPSFSKISDIMGKVQEVKLDNDKGEIPF